MYYGVPNPGGDRLRLERDRIERTEERKEIRREDGLRGSWSGGKLPKLKTSMTFTWMTVWTRETTTLCRLSVWLIEVRSWFSIKCSLRLVSEAKCLGYSCWRNWASKNAYLADSLFSCESSLFRSKIKPWECDPQPRNVKDKCIPTPPTPSLPHSTHVFPPVDEWINAPIDAHCVLINALRSQRSSVFVDWNDGMGIRYSWCTGLRICYLVRIGFQECRT